MGWILLLEHPKGVNSNTDFIPIVQQQLRPVDIFSPLTVSCIAPAFCTDIPDNSILHFCLYSCMILLMCTLWVQWAWRLGFWQAFAAACMAGIFQVAVSSLCQVLSFNLSVPLLQGSQFAVVSAVYFAVVLSTSVLLYRLRFGTWFRLLLMDEGNQRRTALLLFALEAAMETFLLLQSGVRSDYLAQYYFLTLVMAALMTGLVIHLAQRFKAVRQLEAQQDTIARQQLYEQDLEAIRQEVRRFRHDYKNLLAGLSQAAPTGNWISCALPCLNRMQASTDASEKKSRSQYRSVICSFPR